MNRREYNELRDVICLLHNENDEYKLLELINELIGEGNEVRLLEN